MNEFRDFLNRQEVGYSDQEIISIYLGNIDKKIVEIAGLVGKSTGELYRILHNNNVTPNRLKTNHNNVIDFAAAGMPIPQIAELTGYTPRNVRNILGKLRD